MAVISAPDQVPWRESLDVVAIFFLFSQRGLRPHPKLSLDNRHLAECPTPRKSRLEPLFWLPSY